MKEGKEKKWTKEAARRKRERERREKERERELEKFSKAGKVPSQ